jgi:hypothetical protein
MLSREEDVKSKICAHQFIRDQCKQNNYILHGNMLCLIRPRIPVADWLLEDKSDQPNDCDVRRLVLYHKK